MDHRREVKATAARLVGFAVAVFGEQLSSHNPDVPAIQQAASEAMSIAVQQTRKLEAELASARRLLASRDELMTVILERLERLDALFEALEKAKK